MIASESLAGLNVLVTRPAQQQQILLDAITARAGRAIHLPLIEILPLEDKQHLEQIKQQIQALDGYSILVFISTNAVRFCADWIDDYWPQFPLGLELIAIGPTTGKEIHSRLDREALTSAAGMTTEDLLKLPLLNDVADKRIGIVRGLGGRELLAETLRKRGAKVDYLQVYQRTVVDHDQADFLDKLGNEHVNVLSVTSSESLLQLLTLLGDAKAEITLLPLLVPSSRVAALAKDSGFQQVINTKGADESSFIAALEALADKHRKNS